MTNSDDTVLAGNLEVERALASDVSTTAEQLQTLADSSDAATREAVAINPNTPFEVLLSLGAEFPTQLLDNPVFPLLLLEHPNWLEEVSPTTLRSLLKQKNAPSYLLEQAADKADLELQLKWVRHGQTSAKILSCLTRSRHQQVVEEAQLHVNLVGEVIEDYEKQVKVSISNFLGQSSLSSQYTNQLGALVQICAIPNQISEFWIEEPFYRNFCREIAAYPSADPILLTQLARHSDERVRQIVLRNPSLPTTTLQQSAQQGSVRCYAAANPSIPADLVEKLAQDSSEDVRFALASNPQISVSTLMMLASDSDGSVAHAAGQALSSKRLTEIQQSDPQMIAQIMKAHTSPSEDDRTVPAQQLTIQELQALASNPETTADTLKILSQGPLKLREKVAANPNTPASLLAEMAYDDQERIRWEVARNPNTPLKVLFKELARDPKIHAVIGLQMSSQWYDNPEKEHVLDIIAAESTSPLLKLLQQLIREGGKAARLFLALRSDLPVELLAHWPGQAEVEVRVAIAQNNNTPGSVLTQLAQDTNPDIRHAVAQNISTEATTLELMLQHDQDSYLRSLIAAHPALPSSVLEELAKDNDRAIRGSAMNNPNLSPEVAKQIVCGDYANEYLLLHPDYFTKHPEHRTEILNTYVDTWPLNARFWVLRQPEMSITVLQDKSQSEDWLDRFAIAENLSTPLEILRTLAADVNRLVRAAAKQRL